jgi:hypothetical protein
MSSLLRLENVVALPIRFLASELYALVDGYDAAAAIATQLSAILGIVVPVWHTIDSRTLFNVVTHMGNVIEKRLAVDAAELREKHL